MPRRLLIITDEMEVGGTQRQIVELARHIDRNAFSLSLVYFRNGSPYIDELRMHGVSVTCIRKRRRIDPVFFLRLCRFIRQGEFDLVHAFSFTGEVWGWLANFIAGRGGFIGSVRSVYDWYSPLQWNIKRLIALNSVALIANSQAGADHAALQMRVRRSRVQVVLNGMRMPAFPEEQPVRDRKGNGEFRTLFIGRLVDHKNVRCLVNAFALTLKELPGAQLDIVGDGPLRAEIERQIRDLDLEKNVHLHGERHDLATFLRRADAFVCTSLREGLSNAIMEAMFAGIPVVASNVGGNSELVAHYRTGLLFPTDDHETLNAMLCELARNDALRARLGEAARASMRQHHDPGRMAAEMERIYERCLQEQAACVIER